MNQFIPFFQQYAPLFAVLAAVATVLGVAFTIYKTAHDRQVKDLREQVRQKDHRIEQLEREGYDKFRVVNEQLQGQLEKTGKDMEELKASHATAEAAWQPRYRPFRNRATGYALRPNP